MKVRKIMPSVILSLAVTAAFFIAGCGKENHNVEALARGDIQARVYQVEYRHLPVYTRAVGTLNAMNSASLATRIMGQVRNVPVEIGDRVTRGQTIVELDMRDTESMVQQSRANLESAKSNLQNSRSYFRRIEKLHQERSATDQQLDDARMRLEAAEAQVQAAEGGLSGARANLDYSKLTAPFNGYVTRINVDKGDMASPGMPLVVIEQQDSMEVIATVPEREIAKIQVGQVAYIETERDEDNRIEGRVDAVVPSADPRTRTFDVKLMVNNAEKNLRSGQYVKILMETGSARTIAVPTDAVVRRGQLTGLYTVDESGLSRLRWVQLGRSSEDMVEVLSGLNEGDKVIIPESHLLREGLKVTEVSE